MSINLKKVCVAALLFLSFSLGGYIGRKTNSQANLDKYCELQYLYSYDYIQCRKNDGLNRDYKEQSAKLDKISLEVEKEFGKI